jgi:catechol 2,3-dioxygenase-like lactoylglutathione lyase family enzyme
MPLHHVALGAHDVEKLARFYGSAFSLREMRAIPRAITWRLVTIP